MNTVAAYQPFPLADGGTLYIGFLPRPPGAAEARKVLALGGPAEAIHVHGRELYFLVTGLASESAMFRAPIDRMLGLPDHSPQRQHREKARGENARQPADAERGSSPSWAHSIASSPAQDTGAARTGCRIRTPARRKIPLRPPRSHRSSADGSCASITPGATRAKLQEGSFLVGLNPQTSRVSAHWIDSWHNGFTVMACDGTVNDSGVIDVRGTVPVASWS